MDLEAKFVVADFPFPDLGAGTDVQVTPHVGRV
jgi:hypothetical protein